MQLWKTVNTHHVKLQAVVFLHQAQHEHAETCSKTQDKLWDSAWSIRSLNTPHTPKTSFLHFTQACVSHHSTTSPTLQRAS